MRNDGSKLRSLIKGKGYDITDLAKSLSITTAAISKDLQNKELSRKSLIKYVPKIFDSVDSFYTVESRIATKVGEFIEDGNSEIMNYKDEMLAAKDEIIREQRKHIETLSSNIETLNNVIRFFPSAAQLVTA